MTSSLLWFAAELMRCAAVLLAVSSAAVASPAAHYPRMAPVDAYLMDRAEALSGLRMHRSLTNLLMAVLAEH